MQLRHVGTMLVCLIVINGAQGASSKQKPVTQHQCSGKEIPGPKIPDLQVRLKILESWLNAAESSAKQTKDPRLLGIIELLDKRVVPAIPYVRDGFIALEPHEARQPFPLVVLLPIDSRKGGQWKDIIQERGSVLFNLTPRPHLVIYDPGYEENRKSAYSNAAKAVLLLTGGFLVQEYLHQPFRVENGELPTEVERSRRAFQQQLLLLVGKDAYKRLLEERISLLTLTVSEEGVDLPRVLRSTKSDSPQLEEIFAPVSNEEREMWRNVYATHVATELLERYIAAKSKEASRSHLPIKP